MTPEITPARARELLDYDQSTGVLRWKHRAGTDLATRQFNGKHAGREAGTLSLGYIVVNIGGRIHRAHRLAWMIAYGVIPPGIIDHVNMCRTDNRLANLRSATKPQNAVNSGRTARNRSGFKGVCRCGREKKWSAYIRINGKSKRLGSFDTKEAASAAYAAAAKARHGEYARAS